MDDGILSAFLAGQADSNNNSGGNGMFGDGWAGIWGIIILAMVFGWGNGGWGGFGGGAGGGSAAQGALTREQACIDQNFNNLGRTVEGIASAVNQGFQTIDTRVCQQQYETAQQINGVNSNMMAGFNAANVVALQNANAANVLAMQNQNATMAAMNDCCCTTQRILERGFADTNYNMATNTAALQTTIATSTRDIIDSQNAGTRAILDYLCQEKIADLQSENQGLKLAASQAQQNNYLISQLRPTAQPAYLTCNPFTGTYGFPGYGNAYNNGCSGCGC